MVTDEQLIAEIRRELDRELAHIQPSPGLIEAAWEQPRSAATRHRWRLANPVPARRRMRARAVALGALAAAVPVAAVVLVIALLVHSGSQPAPSAVRPNAPPFSAALSPATKAAVRPLTSILGVLRRPQTAADRNAVLTRYLRREDRNPVFAGNFGLPVLSLMRLATGTAWGQRVYVVPFLPPTAAEKRRLPRKYRSGGTPTTATLQLLPMSGNNVTDFYGDGATAAVINGGRALGNGAYDTKVYNHPRQVIMVVPDGVAKVALWYPTGSIANHPKHPITPGSTPVVATVHDNIAAFIAPRRFERPHHGPFSEAGQEIWYGPDGKVVKRIDNANSCGPPLGACS
jgi:hypothetical protein